MDVEMQHVSFYARPIRNCIGADELVTQRARFARSAATIDLIRILTGKRPLCNRRSRSLAQVSVLIGERHARIAAREITRDR